MSSGERGGRGSEEMGGEGRGGEGWGGEGRDGEGILTIWDHFSYPFDVWTELKLILLLHKIHVHRMLIWNCTFL